MNARTTRKRRVKQCELDFRPWGGARRGAGRKPKGEHAMLPHDKRPVHKERFPLLITSRLRAGLPSLRRDAEAALIRNALVRTNLAASSICAPQGRPEEMEAKGRGVKPRGLAPFQIVHHSIQSNHLHLIVEAADRAAVTSGMRRLLIRIARALNRLWKRTGSVFVDRFHEHELHTPREVRNALVYVLQNLNKHHIWLDAPDPLSSGPAFDGWQRRSVGRVAAGFGSERRVEVERGRGATEAPNSPWLRAARADAPNPKTWLLGVGWRRHGLIDPSEQPRLSE